ncbi:hypothetical protein LR48_Vigan10g104400 [Vigna angularis]|uniref:Uncharacterized protein n=1 Tax=Phaseolus angularis TaxID=3914 RepID=A0A0L9VJR1_PHAAN|nr:hypothetical protein LR48_Vigan10g104400 [Vigna angularis]
MKKIEDNRRKMVEMNKELRTLAAMEEKEDVEDVLDVAPVVRIVARHQQINEDAHLLNVNRKYLYNLVIPFKLPWRVVSEICGQTFDTQECYSFAPRMQLGNMGILFATSVFMFFERRST